MTRYWMQEESIRRQMIEVQNLDILRIPPQSLCLFYAGFSLHAFCKGLSIRYVNLSRRVGLL